MISALMEQRETLLKRVREVGDIGTERATLAAIRARLYDIGRGFHPVCVDCGEEIRCSRLRAVPLAERCVPCQKAAEVAALDCRRRLVMAI